MNNSFRQMNTIIKSFLIDSPRLSLFEAERTMQLVHSVTRTEIVMRAISIRDKKAPFHSSSWNKGYLQALKDIQEMDIS